jgi:hypothetical protein
MAPGGAVEYRWADREARMKEERVVFEIANGDRFQQLAAFVRALAIAKGDGNFHDDAYWERFLDEGARAAFWWPSSAEIEDWQRRWFSTPVERRSTDPSLKTPWIFASLIDAARDGDFENLQCSRIGTGAAIEFQPCAWPFGGTAWMRALIEAYGGYVTEDTAD